MGIRVLKPGLLVSLRTSLKGGIAYERAELEAPAPATETEDVARWETTRVIDDKAEYDRGSKLQGKVSGMIRNRCIETENLGLLCPKDREDELDKAVADAQALVDEFNTSTRHSMLTVWAVKWRMAEDEEEATAALAAEVRGLLDQVDRGIRDVNVETIRAAATRAKYVGKMLDGKQAEQVTEAVLAARKAATTIARRVEKLGEDAEVVMAELKTEPIATARFAFLDLEEHASEGEELPAVSAQRMATVVDDEGGAEAADGGA